MARLNINQNIIVKNCEIRMPRARCLELINVGSRLITICVTKCWKCPGNQWNLEVGMCHCVSTLKFSTLKPRYNEQVSQTLFVHYIEYFTISNVISLVNPQIWSWVLFTISWNSLYPGLLYRGLSVRICTQILFSFSIKNTQKCEFLD